VPELTAAHQHDVTVLEDITVSQPPQLQGRIMTGTTDTTASSRHPDADCDIGPTP
jgi:hypothetical protein